MSTPRARPAPRVGLALQPDREYLALLDPVLRRSADYLEVAPETTWQLDSRGRLVPNDFHRYFAALGASARKPFVAHGVGLSLGTAAAADAPRRRRWLRRLARDQQIFRYRWYTDHLGMTSVAGAAVTLPVALPMTAGAAAIVRARLRSMQRVVPDVGCETTAHHFLLGHALDEPAFIATILSRPRTHLLLDLHNVLVMADNLGFDARTYLERLLALGLGERVIELHVSGGSRSDPRWLPSGRALRLDSHDGAVPEPVWELLAEVLPACPRLRGVTLERMEGTVLAADVPVVRDELERIRAAIARAWRPRTSRGRRTAGRLAASAALALPRLDAATHAWIEETLAEVLFARDPVGALEAARDAPDAPAAARPYLEAVDPDGLRMSALLVAKLRFERLTQGSSVALRAFERDPAAFADDFRRYHHAVRPRVFSVQEEGRVHRAWVRRHDAARQG